jgi:uncharacterized membrane protein HdeD (DUF308 family)
VKINIKKAAFTSFIALLPMILGIVLLPQLPQQVARLLLGIVFILIGNYTPKIPQEQNNSLYSKNLSPEKYRKGMKIIGILFFAIGILVLVSMFFYDAMLPIIMGTGLLAFLVFFFSYMIK